MISQRIPKPIEDIYKLSQRSRTTRFFSGILVGLIVWLTGIAFAFLLNPFVGDNVFVKTFLHDLPGFTLVFGLVLLLEFWGLIPRLEQAKSSSISEEK